MAADAPARRNGRRRGAQSAQPSPPPNALVASAARLTAEKVRRTSAGAEWQGRAWDYYDAVGGLAYVSEFYRNALARIRLVPKRIAPDGTLTDVEGGAPVDILQAFGGGPLAQRALIGSLGVHMFVPGEAYLVGRDVLDEQGAETGAQSWAVHSTDELTQAGSGYTLNIGDGDIEQLDEATLVVRIWQPHPRRSWLPNSPVLHVLTDLAEYVGLAQWVQATIDSRLAGAGLLLLPQEVTFAEGAGQPAQGEADPFIAELTDTMVTAIKDRDSAAAVVPLIAKMPGEWLDKVRLVTFWSEFSEHVIPMREATVDRVEMGLSIPKGVMSGTVDANHWGAWAIADDTIKFHIEPAIQGICAALTAGYYQPALEAAGLTPAEAARFLLWYDATALTQRPNSVPETTELYDRGLVQGKVLLRVAGLNPDTDMAEEADLARIERVKAADTAAPPGVGIGEQGPAGGTPQRPGPPPVPATVTERAGLTAAITAGGIVLPAEVEATFAGDTPPPLELPREMGDGPPPCDCTAEALTATVDGLLFRALEIVGGRMRGRLPHGAPNDGLAAHQVHEHHHSRPKPSVLFANLWKTVPELAAQVGVDPELLTAALDTELRDTVTAMRPYDPAAAARIAADLMVG